MKIFNGEKRDITVITDAGSVVIPAQETREIEVPEDAEFGQSEFYVEENGDWYIKTEDCFIPEADAEIHDAQVYNEGGQYIADAEDVYLTQEEYDTQHICPFCKGYCETAPREDGGESDEEFCYSCNRTFKSADYNYIIVDED